MAGARKVPLWARALQRSERLAYLIYQADMLLRDEVLRAFLPAHLHDAVIEQAYASLTEYLPGGAVFARGLFEWEQRALSSDFFPRSGRVLLGAAGGGRELVALVDRGYDVVAFEPNAALRSGAERVARPSGTRVIDASYRHLVQAAEHGTGPLAELLSGPQFDAAILGWGSFTHLTDPREQAAVLAALRHAAPRAPVLVSFYVRKAAETRGKQDRLRDALRAVFGALGGRTDVPAGVAYEGRKTGFVYYFGDGEMDRLAHAAGYRVAFRSDEAFGHALLVPRHGDPS